MGIDINANTGWLILGALVAAGLLTVWLAPHLKEKFPRAGGWIAIVVLAVLLIVALVVVSGQSSCTASAQDRHRTPEEHKLTALMAARVVANETAIALQCVPWERREGCVNDLGMVIQRTRDMAGDRTLYEELRRHSPRATGRCLELAEQGVPRAEWPRRCRSTPTGNVRWSPGLRMDGREPTAWRDVVGLPWSAREARWHRILRDAGRLLGMQWRPCDGRVETWGGAMDTPGPGLVAVECGSLRNTPYARRLRGGTISAAAGRGDPD